MAKSQPALRVGLKRFHRQSDLRSDVAWHRQSTIGRRLPELSRTKAGARADPSAGGDRAVGLLG